MLEKADKRVVKELNNLFDDYCYTLYNKHFPFTENNVKKYITEVYQEKYKNLESIEFVIDEFQITVTVKDGICRFKNEIINGRLYTFRDLYDCKTYVLKC